MTAPSEYKLEYLETTSSYTKDFENWKLEYTGPTSKVTEVLSELKNLK